MAIARVGAANAASASITGPNGTAGDIIIYHTFRSTAATVPTVAAGTWSLGSSSGSTCAYNTCYEFCTSGTASSRTFTGATQIVAVRYSGVYGIGALNFAAIASSPTMAYGAIASPIQGGGNSWFVGCGAHRTATNVNTAPAGMSTITSGSVGTGPMACVFDTNGGAASYAGANVTVNATSGRVANVVELLGSNSTWNPYLKSTLITLSGSNLTAAPNAAITQQNSVLGTLGRTTGKYLIKITPTLDATYYLSWGIATAGVNLNTYVGATTTDVCFFNYFGDAGSGIAFNNAQVGVDAPHWTSGVAQYMAFDFNNSLCWVVVDGTAYGASGNPANPDSGVDGFSFAGIDAGPYFPIFSAGENGGTQVVWDGSCAGAPSNVSTFVPWDTMGGSIYNVSQSESGSAADTPSSVATLPAAASEAGTAAETVNGVGVFPRTVGESASAADTSGSVATLPAAIAEAGAAADTPNGVGVFPRTVSEAGTAADTVAQGSVFSTSVTEAATAAETESAQLGAVGALAEAATAADTEASQAALVAAAAETASAADAPASAAVLPSSVSETAAGADSPSMRLVVSPAVGEAGSPSDTVSSAAVLPAGVTEAGNAQDTDDLNPPIAVGLVEAAAAQDAVSAVLVGVGGVTEAVTPSDQVGGGAVVGGAVAESASAQDLTAAQFSFACALVEHGLAADMPAAVGVLYSGVLEAGLAIDRISQEVPGVTASKCNTLGSAPRVRLLGSAPRIRLLGGSCCP